MIGNVKWILHLSIPWYDLVMVEPNQPWTSNQLCLHQQLLMTDLVIPTSAALVNIEWILYGFHFIWGVGGTNSRPVQNRTKHSLCLLVGV